MRDERCRWRERRGRDRQRLPPRHRRALLHKKIFVWFGVSIVLTIAVTFLTVGFFTHHTEPWNDGAERAHRFIASRFSRVWEEPDARGELARAIAEEFGIGVELQGENGEVYEAHGPECQKTQWLTDVEVEGKVVGRVGLCFPKHGHPPWVLGVALLVAASTLWALTGMLARHIARPLRELTQLTEEIGAGKLSRRVRLDRHHSGEVGLLSESINDMAMRIEQQMSDQRELLATVSHEVRTPLGHLAVLIELLRTKLDEPKLADDMDREVREIDSLMGELLASSRLDFSALAFHTLNARDIALRALERASLDATVLVDETTNGSLHGDATLLGRALANLLDNATKHGRGVVALRITEEASSSLAFSVEDAGSGFSEEGLLRAFDTFYRDRPRERQASSLGLGLALVKRIAVAHGGDVWAENLPGGGARVGIRVARRPPVRSEVPPRTFAGSR